MWLQSDTVRVKMPLKMTSTCMLLALVLAAMFVGASSQKDNTGFSSQEVQKRCQKNKTAIFAHPGQCQLYYNCSHTVVPSMYSHFTQFLQECHYPMLFSYQNSRCQRFDRVSCGKRVEHFDQCKYLRYKCGRSHCIPCSVRHPSCVGLPDGMNVYRGKKWSPFYVVCRSQRPLRSKYCPRHPTLEITQLFHPGKRRCVSLYEIPKRYGGYLLNCTQKADGLHLDDSTRRPDVYYHCHGGQLMDVQKCKRGQYFDEQRFTCAVRPVRNSIMRIPK